MTDPTKSKLATMLASNGSGMFGMNDPWAWQSARQKKVRTIIHSMLFEYSMATVIVGNVVLIIVETDYLADKGHDEEPYWISIPSAAVLLVFVAELALRLYSEQCAFFRDEWNIFDLVVISGDAIASVVALALGRSMPISVLRVLRLCKVARISQLFRVFSELKLIMIGLIGAIRAMMWGTILLFIALLVISITAVQMIQPLNLEVEKTGIYDGCDRCGRAFQTVFAAILTFSQQILTGDSWGLVSIPIIEAYPATAFYFAGVYLIIGLAILNLLLGLIVDVAQQARQKFEREQEHHKQMQKREKQSHLMKMCCEMDNDHSGYLTKAELFDGYANSPAFRKTLKELGVEEEDMEVVWICMDSDNSGNVSYSEFVDNLYSMKTSDSEFMLSYIKYYVTIIKNEICAGIKETRQDLAGMMRPNSLLEQGENQKIDLLATAMKKETESVRMVEELENAKLTQLLKKDGKAGNGQVSLPTASQNVTSVIPSCLQDGRFIFDIMEEMRRNQTELSQRFIDMERNVERSMSRSLSRPAGTAIGLWPIPAICQNVTPARKDSSQRDSPIF